jgi:DNA-binding NarL/FixJ family response regulator
MNRCLVADAHPVLVAAVCKYIEASGYAVIGPAAEGYTAVAAAAAEQRIDVRTASERLGAAIRTQAVATALRRGLVE